MIFDWTVSVGGRGQWQLSPSVFGPLWIWAGGFTAGGSTGAGFMQKQWLGEVQQLGVTPTNTSVDTPTGLW